MTRVLAGSAAAALAVGLAGSFVAPTLSGVPHGEPMLVAGSDSAALLQQASFDEAACAERLLLAERETAPVRFVAIAVQASPGGLALAVEEIAPHAAVPEGTLIFALSPNGKVVGLWDAAEFRSRAGDALLAGCAEAEPHEPVAGSI